VFENGPHRASQSAAAATRNSNAQTRLRCIFK
jgi:hypothetical protein